MSPLVSIVNQTFNRRHQVLQALESIAKRSYPHLEAILMDDAIHDSDDVASGVRLETVKPREGRAMRVVSMRGGKKIILVRVNVEQTRPQAEQWCVSEAIAVRGSIHLAPMYPA
jgi:hypothetical protein